MSPGALVAEFAVPFYGALLCVAPAVTKPTVQFGVRIPPERTGATVIGDQRRAYIYVNRDDPSLMVGARFGVGWTFNLANPAAWLLLSAIAGVPAGLVIIAVFTR